MADEKVKVSAEIGATDTAGPVIAGVEKALGRLRLAGLRVSESFQRLGGTQLAGAFRGLGSAIGGVIGRVGDLARPLLGLMGITGGVSMAGAVAGLQSYVQRIRDISRTANVLGTTTQRLSAMQYAASRVGISTETFNNAMMRAQQMMGKARWGKGNELTAIFRRLGISLNQNALDALPAFARAVAYQTDPMLRMKMAVAMFGRALGPEMLKLLNQGSDGIATFIEKAKELGLVVGPEQAAEAEQYAKTQREFAETWMQLSNAISRILLPVLNKILPIFSDLMREFKPAIIQSLTKAFGGLAIEAWALGSLKSSIRQFILDVVSLGSTISSIVEYIGGWKVAAISLGLVMTGLVGPIMAVAGALGTLAIAMATTPIGWAAMAIATAVLLIKNWEAVRQFFVNFWNDPKATFNSAVSSIMSLLDRFTPTLIKNLWRDVSSFFAGLWADVRALFSAFADWLGAWGNLFLPTFIYNNWQGIKDFFAKLLSGDVVGTFNAALAVLKTVMAQFIPKSIKDAWSGITKWFSDLWAAVIATFDRALGEVLKFVGKIGGAIKSIPGVGRLLAGAAPIAASRNDGSAASDASGTNGAENIPARGSIVSHAMQAQTPPQRAEIDGAVRVEVRAMPGTEARVRADTRGPIQVANVGYTMEGVA